jgi:integrase
VARTPSPWFRAARAVWCVTVRGKHHNLGSHPEGFPAPRKQRGRWNAPDSIKQRFYELLADSSAPDLPDAPTAAKMSVAEVCEKYLDWCQKHRSARTYEWYQDHIQRFLDSLPDPAGMPAADLKPFRLVEWADRHPTWGDSHRRGALIAVQRPFNWAAKLGYIPANPLRGLELPEIRRRENPVTPDDFAAILGQVKDHPFRDLLTFAWETGCRPQEARHIEARHLHLNLNRIEIPPAEAKGKKRWRVIYLSPVAGGIVSRLAAAHSTGKLFRNVDGNAWKVHAVNCRFFRLKAKLGRRFASYDLRHAFATRKLKAGVDPITLAGLLGHRDATMLCRHYEHVTGDGGHLLDAVSRPSATPSRA